MDLNWWYSKSRNRHCSANDKSRAGIDLNSMIRQNLRDLENDMESFNGNLVVSRAANFDNVVGEQNDLVPDINDDHDIPWVGINPDEFTQVLLNFHVCQQASFANDVIICDNVHNDKTSTKEMVSLGFGHQNTGCLDYEKL